MRYITILMAIIVWWFLVAMGLGFLSQDEFINSNQLDGNTSFDTIGTEGMNFTSLDFPEQNSISKWKTAISFLFGFNLGTNLDIPVAVAVIITFINWFSVLLSIVCIYKIGNPLSSG